MHEYRASPFIISGDIDGKDERTGAGTEGLFLYECIGRWIPAGIASGFKSCADPAGRKAGSIWFTLDQILAGKLHDHGTIFFWIQEGIVFLGIRAGER